MGWSEDRLVGPAPHLQHLGCPVCLEVTKDAVQCPDQHHGCAACLTQVTQCPECRVPIDNLPPARVVRRKVNALVVRCEFMSQGCDHQCIIEVVDTHESFCEFQPITCPNDECEDEFLKMNLDQHRQQ